eukprot:c16675_g1_i1.p1 GENE.c16675_g1_i1~~c16675_g1_i1.p1  ORF type:complete len:227 (+),score=12.29 c16675_g1_i1:57-737(+)
MRRATWTKEEDAQLVEIVQAHNLDLSSSWHGIATLMEESKTPRQCRERWRNVLDPSLNRGPWTHLEDAVLTAALNSVGRKWAEIAKLLPGRTDTAVKNRASSLASRQQSPQVHVKTSLPSLHSPKILPGIVPYSTDPNLLPGFPANPAAGTSEHSPTQRLPPFHNSMSRYSYSPRNQLFERDTHSVHSLAQTMAEIGKMPEPPHSEEYLTILRQQARVPSSWRPLP